MKNINFRTLRADEIEVRPQSIKNGKASMLLYIDSRAVISLLNETVGNMNWQSDFYTANGQTFGKIGIYDEDRNIWIWKSDVGSESNVEAEKGKISDTYKRILSRWGVQELYTAPRITIDDDGRGNSGYKVSHIEYDEHRNIIALKIVNRYGKEAYSWEKGANIEESGQTSTNTTKMNNKEVLTQFCSERKRLGDNTTSLLRFYNFYEPKMSDWSGVFNAKRQYAKWSNIA